MSEMIVRRTPQATIDFGQAHDDVTVSWGGPDYVVLTQNSSTVMIPFDQFLAFANAVRDLLEAEHE